MSEPSKTVSIHKLNEADIPAFLAFFRSSMPVLFPQYTSHSIGYLVDVDYGPIWLTEQIKKGNKRAYLAQDGDAIVGYVLYGPPICGVSFADWLAVDKKYQKQGIATRLLAKWEQDVLKDGAHNIHLWTWDFDVPFYRNRQFQQAGILPKAWCGFDCHLMYKILREPEEKNYLKKYLRKIKKG